MYDNGYGGKNIGYGRDRISDFPMHKPSGRKIRIPISDDFGFGITVLLAIGIVVLLLWNIPILLNSLGGVAFLIIVGVAIINTILEDRDGNI